MTTDIMSALTFIKHNIITQSEWRRNGKPAYGEPSKWNEFRMGNKSMQMTISKETQAAIRRFTEIGPDAAKGGSLYVVNAAGLAYLEANNQ